MDLQAGIKEVQRLLYKEYGVGIDDCVDIEVVERDLANGEDPQAIVDWIADKFHLDRIDSPRQPFAGFQDHSLN